MKTINYRGCLMEDKNTCWFYQEELVIEYYDEYFNIWQLII